MIASAICEQCGVYFERPNGQIGRCGKMFCSMKCAGMARRKHRTDAEKKQIKARYDEKYRAINAQKIKSNKREYFAKTYDPRKARIARAKMMPRHVEYCRRPEYRKYKAKYDAQYNASEYGPFADAYRLYVELSKEIRQRCPSAYERRKAKGYYDGCRPNTQERKREAQMSRH